jgi:UDP-glucuronate 4-epimerase
VLLQQMKDNIEQRILVTGAAGFIGMHTCLALLRAGHRVVGLDSLPDDQDATLRAARLGELGIAWHEGAVDWHAEVAENGFTFIRMDICDREALPALFAEQGFTAICHLAARGGVRRSIEEPFAYAESNIAGFLNVLECCRHYGVRRLVYASSSSVYGNADTTPFQITDRTDTPVSLYAATKKSNELMAHAYADLFGMETIGLRFFTVYGPWGRPDMAMYLFTDAILRGTPLKVFNHGRLSRDFTYVDDIVAGILTVLLDPTPEAAAMHRVYNIGNSHPVPLLDFIRAIEESTGRAAKLDMQPMQPGDVETTYADVTELARDHGYAPTTDIREGVRRYVEWFRRHHRM